MKSYQYFKAYGEKYLKRISLNLNKEKDKDILEAINKEDPGNIQRAVKKLIRKAIEIDNNTPC